MILCQMPLLMQNPERWRLSLRVWALSCRAAWVGIWLVDPCSTVLGKVANFLCLLIYK